MTAPTPSEPTEPRQQAEQGPILGHHFDGIREYDNPMPGWWIWIFWVTIIIAPIYVLGVHVFGYINSYEDDLQEDMGELQEIRMAYETATPSSSFDVETLAAYAEDPAAIEAGGQTYQTYCLPCHGAAGEGGIGPNLTDDYWIHGNQLTDMFQVVTQGVVDKGMTPWDGILTPEQRAQVVAFVHSLHGTTPPNAKAPQGDLIES